MEDTRHRAAAFMTGAGRFGRVVLEALFPGRCVACRRLYRIGQRAPAQMADGSLQELAHEFLCRRCAADFKAIGSPNCTLCGRPFVSEHGPDHVCGRCLRRPFAFSTARSAGRYEGGLRALIHHLKYKGCVHVAKPLSRLLWEDCRRRWPMDAFDLFLPVPLHKRRMRRRGFNQTEQLLRPWPRLSGERSLKRKICFDVLVRERDTPPQTGLNQKQRNANVKKAFRVAAPVRIKGAAILIVDDVFTTGATVNACAHSLLRAGALRVCVATLARSVAGT